MALIFCRHSIDERVENIRSVSLEQTCRVVFTIKDDNKEDDGKPSNDFKELVTVSVEAGDPTDVVGEEGEPFLMDSKKKIGS